MNTFEACNLLGIQAGATSADVKVAFKNKAKEHHPDKDKTDGAEDRFKKINEAYQFLEKYGTSSSTYDAASAPAAAADFLAQELRRKMDEAFGKAKTTPLSDLKAEPIIVHLSVSVEEFITGSTKEIPITKRIKCETCLGSGKVILSKKMCPKCNGSKYRTYGNDTSGKRLPCVTCEASGFVGLSATCFTCHGLGMKHIEHTLSVSLPPRLNRVVLPNFGHWQADDTFGSVIVSVSFSDEEMRIDGEDVISIVELSLLEAIQGTKKRLRTIKGERTLAFKPGTQNKDTIKVTGFGLPPNGSHIFIVSVQYPDNVDGLIEYLSKDGYQEKDEPLGYVIEEPEPND